MSKSPSKKTDPYYKEYLDQSLVDCSKVVSYRKKGTKGKRIQKVGYLITGLQLDDGWIHESPTFGWKNMFFAKPTKIPANYEKEPTAKKHIKKYHCSPGLEVITPKNVPQGLIHKTGSYYSIMDNGAVPWIAWVSPKQDEVSIYAFNSDKYTYPAGISHKYEKTARQRAWIYRDLIQTFKNIRRVHVGSCNPREVPKQDAWQCQDRFRGNSLLLETSKPGECIFIGWDIYRFKLAPNDITNDSESKSKSKSKSKLKYFSPVGNSSVPYPILWTDKNVYFMIEKKYAPRDNRPINPLDYFIYDPKYPQAKIKKIPGIKMIQKRAF